MNLKCKLFTAARKKREQSPERRAATLRLRGTCGHAHVQTHTHRHTHLSRALQADLHSICHVNTVCQPPSDALAPSGCGSVSQSVANQPVSERLISASGTSSFANTVSDCNCIRARAPGAFQRTGSFDSLTEKTWLVWLPKSSVAFSLLLLFLFFATLCHVSYVLKLNVQQKPPVICSLGSCTVMREGGTRSVPGNICRQGNF